MLYTMYSDEKNLAFLLFLRPLLSDLQRVNKLFESNSVDPTKLVNELVTFICSIGKLFVIPTFNFNPITKDFSIFLNPNQYLSYGFEKKS